jgi:hypothetical protein
MNTGSDVTQERIRKALAGVLLPLARTLLRCGVSYTEFADLSKRAFVEAASADYGVRNRPTNIARVAVMTGLSRKEVSRIRAEGERSAVSNRNLPAEVLHCWHTNPQFLDRDGQPRALRFSGGEQSFSGLVRTVTTDIPARAMHRELQRSGALASAPNRMVKPARREFVPHAVDEKLIDGLQFGLKRLVETISFNADPENRGKSRFQRLVHTDRIPLVDVPMLRDSIHAILTSFSTRLDDQLTSFQSKKRRRLGGKDSTSHVGVGLYYFDDAE